MKSPAFWRFNQFLLIVFWLLVPLAPTLNLSIPYLNELALIIFAAHVLEIPLALTRLKHKQIPKLRIAARTLVFGFTWWLPVEKGVVSP